MPTLIYNPGVRVYIKPVSRGVLAPPIDVTDDLIQGNVTRRADGVSTANFTIMNTRRKYDGLFTPNDRIVIQMKRLTWMTVFTGYLNAVPLITVWPTSVDLSASCTLKRLQYWYWDSGLSASQQLVANEMQAAGGASAVGNPAPDGGIKNAAMAILDKVVGWPSGAVHIGQIPADWFKWAGTIAAQAVSDHNKAVEAIASAAAVVGAGPSLQGSSVVNSLGVVTLPGVPAGIAPVGTIPATSGKCSSFGGPGDTTTVGTHTAITGEQVSPQSTIDGFYCAMRWQYEILSPRGPNPSVDTSAAVAFLRGKDGTGLRVIVSNPSNGKAVCVRVSDWGPGGISDADQRVIDLGPDAMAALGASTDDTVNIAFAQDQTTKPGPITVIKNGTGKDSATATSTQGTVNRANGGANLTQAAGGKTAADFLGVALGFVKAHPSVPYSESDPSTYTTLADQVVAFDCSSFVRWCVYQLMGSLSIGNTSTGDLPRTIGVVAQDMLWWYATNGTLHDDPETGMNTVGAIMIVAGQHTEISLGDGLHTVGFHHGGTVGGVIPYPASAGWTHWATLPNVDYTGATNSNSAQQAAAAAAASGAGDSGGTAGGTSSATGTTTGTGAVLQTGTDTPASSNDPIDRLFNGVAWSVQPNGGANAASQIYTGAYALYNDDQILSYLKSLLNCSLRSFSSAPNGDFIAWFPDYYGIWGTAAVMQVEPIELMDFTVTWSDDSFVTHQFVTPTVSSIFDPSTGTISDTADPGITDTFVVSVENPAVMTALFGEEAGTTDQIQAYVRFILNRFGARPDHQQAPGIQGPKGAFFYALFLFMRQWAYQYNADVPMTFMPELWPGMLLQVPAYNFQAYVTTVSHSFSFQGSGFQTQANIAAPARITGSPTDLLQGLPLAGKYSPITGATQDTGPTVAPSVQGATVKGRVRAE